VENALIELFVVAEALVILNHALVKRAARALHTKIVVARALDKELLARFFFVKRLFSFTAQRPVPPVMANSL
jgi:hypothetical protein